MRISFEIDQVGSPEVGFWQSSTDSAASGIEQETTAIDAGPAPASLVSALGDDGAAPRAPDHRDAGPPPPELVEAINAATGTGSLTSADLSTNGGSSSAVDAGSAPE